MPKKNKKQSKKKQAENRDQILNNFQDQLKVDPNNLVAALGVAFYYNNSGNEGKILEILERFVSKYPFESNEHNNVFDKLLAYGYSNSGQYVNAEAVIDRAIKNDDKSLDLFYLKTYAQLSLRNYDEAIKSGKKYLTNYSYHTKNNQKPNNESAITPGHHSQLSNFVGSAYREKADFSKAEKYFKRSIETDSGNHLPYLNLLNMYRFEGKQDLAKEILEQGLIQCREIQELRMFQQSLTTNATVSACMMVKDEEEMLPACLASIRDWVDEIIVIDTGSTDKTVEIAESYGAKVFHHPWGKNFSLHRNQSIEKASSEWIFIIDADERICGEDIPRLKDALTRPEFSMISINVYNIYGRHQEIKTFLPSIRFFRREKNFRYDGIVHNRLIFPEDTPVLRVPVKIEHYGYDLSKENMTKKFNRSKELLKKQLKEDKDNVFSLFNYAQLLRGEGTEFQTKNVPEILKAASRVIELTDPKDENVRHVHLMCLDQISWAYFYNGDYEKALVRANKALKIKPDYLDPLLLLGHAYSRMKDYDNAKESYKKYLAAQSKFDDTAETDNIILLHPESQATALYGLAAIAEIDKDFQLAKSYYMETLKENKRYLSANSSMGRIFKSEGNLIEAERFFLNQIEMSDKNFETVVSLAEIYHSRNEYDDAEKNYKEALIINKDSAMALLGYGKLCQELDREEEAVEMFDRAASRSKLNTGSKKELASAFFKTGNFKKASSLYEEILKDEKENPEILNDLGNCFFKLEKYKKAEEIYNSVIILSPDLSVTYRNLGMSHIKQENHKKALEAFTKYLEKEPDSFEIVHIVADLNLKLSQYETALNYFEKYLRQVPSNHLAFFNLGECYLNMGHRDSAIMGYQQALKIKPEFLPAKDRITQLEISSEMRRET